MTKVKHDLRHYQSFWEMPAQTNVREPVKSFRRVARLCFYRHNPFRFWTVLSDPEHPNRAYQDYDGVWCGPCFPRAPTDSFDAGAPTGTLVLPRRKLTIFFIAKPGCIFYNSVGRLWYGEPDAVANAIGCTKFYSRSHNAVIRVYDEAGSVIETHEHKGDFKERRSRRSSKKSC
jgi:hypothetical protein